MTKSINIDVKIYGPYFLGLKQKADNLIAANRTAFTERQRIKLAQNTGKKKRQENLARLGKTSTGQAWDGQFVPRKKPEEIGPRRWRGDSVIGAIQDKDLADLRAGTQVTWKSIGQGSLAFLPDGQQVAVASLFNNTASYELFDQQDSRVKLYSASGNVSVDVDLPSTFYAPPTDLQPFFSPIGTQLLPGFGGLYKVFKYKWIFSNLTFPDSYGDFKRLGFLFLPVKSDVFITILLHKHTAFHTISNVQALDTFVFQSYSDEEFPGDFPGQTTLQLLQESMLEPTNPNSTLSQFTFSLDPISFDYSTTFPNVDVQGTSSVTNNEQVKHTEKFYKAYICSNNSIREIQVKGALLDLVKDPDYFGEVPDQNSKDFQASFGKVFTPSVFAKINQRLDFVNPDVIKQFRESSSPVLSDQRIGFFAISETGKPSYGLTPEWAKWRGTVADVPPPDHGNPELYLRYKKIRLGGVSFSLSGAEQEEEEDEGNYTGINYNWVWDWDDPSYCRRMCLALGFTLQDLVP